jgi:hypothetical protein
MYGAKIQHKGRGNILGFVCVYGRKGAGLSATLGLFVKNVGKQLGCLDKDIIFSKHDKQYSSPKVQRTKLIDRLKGFDTMIGRPGFNHFHDIIRHVMVMDDHDIMVVDNHDIIRHIMAVDYNDIRDIIVLDYHDIKHIMVVDYHDIKHIMVVDYHDI